MQRAQPRVQAISKTLPSWHATGHELKAWQKQFGVFLLPGCLAQLVIVDLKDPIGILLQKPVRIQRENGVITGAFILNEGNRKGIAKKYQPKPFYIAAVYDSKAKAFVYEMDGGMLRMVLDNKWMQYLLGDDRKKVKAQLTILK